PIDYRREDFERVIQRETAGEGVDIVFDTIGGANWARSYRCLKRGGLLVGFGALQMTTGEEKLPSLLWGFARLMGLWKLRPDGRDSTFYNIQTRREKLPREFRDDVQALFALLQEGVLQPAIAATVSLQDIPSVHRQIDNAEIAGKVVVLCNT
ncbi:MAG: zinc-binding dehydrogenase, partial [Gammaproteobacteria bacterium]|nr:zinc-binding dehydrogenase [Gammaproteobacteria bacterium]